MNSKNKNDMDNLWCGDMVRFELIPSRRVVHMHITQKTCHDLSKPSPQDEYTGEIRVFTPNNTSYIMDNRITIKHCAIHSAKKLKKKYL